MRLEAQILCSHPCEIPDLGLRLLRGEERWLCWQVAAGSSDLRKELAKGNVRVYRKARRDKAPKLPQPPFVALQRPLPRPQSKAEPAVEERVVEPSLDIDALAMKIKTELIGDLRPAISEEVGRAVAEVQASQASQGAPLDAGQLETVLESVLRRVLPSGSVPSAPSVSAPAVSRAAAPEDPLYMPTRLVDPETRAKITVQKQETENAEVDEAAEALRAHRKRRG
jgi:hypothetical protein